MRRADDERLWFDKADGKTIYGIYPDQRFYSSQYEPVGDEVYQVQFLLEISAAFSEWCKQNYLSVRAGREQLPLPAVLQMVTNRMEEVDNGETQEAEAQQDETDGEEGGV